MPQDAVAGCRVRSKLQHVMLGPKYWAQAVDVVKVQVGFPSFKKVRFCTHCEAGFWQPPSVL